MRTELVGGALKAVDAARGGLTGAIFHLYHGSQASPPQWGLWARADSALAESFNAALKRKVLQDNTCEDDAATCCRQVLRGWRARSGCSARIGDGSIRIGDDSIRIGDDSIRISGSSFRGGRICCAARRRCRCRLGGLRRRSRILILVPLGRGSALHRLVNGADHRRERRHRLHLTRSGVVVRLGD